MKPSVIVKILIKAIALPIIVMFMLNKWNICEYVTFIPSAYRFQTGTSVYLALLEAVVGFIEYFIAKAQATVKCTFYANERREDEQVRPIIQIDDDLTGTGRVWCHIILDGSYRTLSGTEIYLDIPQWFSIQLDANNSLELNDRRIKWKVSSLLPVRDNKKTVHTDIRMQISFIQNSPNDASIDIEPTVTKRRGLEFKTNGITVQNKR